MIALAWLACASEPAAPPGMAAPRHAAGWDELVAAAERGDVSTAKVLARDLSLGDVPDDDPAASALGAALGFLQIAEDPEDLADGIARARAACVACHARRDVTAAVR